MLSETFPLIRSFTLWLSFHLLRTSLLSSSFSFSSVYEHLIFRLTYFMRIRTIYNIFSVCVYFAFDALTPLTQNHPPPESSQNVVRMHMAAFGGRASGRLHPYLHSYRIFVSVVPYLFCALFVTRTYVLWMNIYLYSIFIPHKYKW